MHTAAASDADIESVDNRTPEPMMQAAAETDIDEDDLNEDPALPVVQVAVDTNIEAVTDRWLSPYADPRLEAAFQAEQVSNHTMRGCH